MSEDVYVCVEKTLNNTSQMCWMPSVLMSKCKIKVGDFVEIQTNQDKCIISKVLPYIFTDTKYGYQTIVTPHVISNVSHINELEDIQNCCVEIKNIRPLSNVDIKSVTLIVVMNSTESILQSKKHQFTFKDDVRQLLKQYKIVNKSIVNCLSNPLAKLMGVSYFIVCEAICKDKEIDQWVGSVCADTDVCISSVESEERHLYLVEEQISLGGLDEILSDLKSLIQDPWNFKKEFSKSGVVYPSGVLLVGPPGCGKSSLVKQLCHETGACLIATAGGELQSTSEDETLSNLTKVVKRACTLSEEGSCVFFIDEIDSLCPSRTSESSAQDMRLTAQVLLSLDRCRDFTHLLVMGATNRPYALDPSLRRSGRLEIEILLNTPTHEARKHILSLYCQDLVPHNNPGLEDVASATPGFVGADLRLLCEKTRSSESVKSGASVDEICSKMVSLAVSIQPSIHKTLDFISAKPAACEVGGLDDVMTELKLIMSRNPEVEKFYELFKLKRPKGVLLYGPRGCGKTRLVSSLAAHRGFTFLSANSTHLLSPYVGESEKRIAALFHAATLAQPSIVFIDEIDGIFGSRDAIGSGVRVNLLTELLQAMDGADVRATSVQGSGRTGNRIGNFKNDILVFAATNNPHKLDSALLRPGRFDYVLYVPPPDRPARLDILKIKTKKLRMESKEVVLDRIANESERWSGAELENLVSQAAIESVLAGNVNEESEDISIPADVILGLFSRFSPSLTLREIEFYEKFQEKFKNKIGSIL